MTIALHGARALPLILALQACASGSPAGDDPFSRQNAPRPVRIEVTNRNFADVTIWAVYPGDRLRLGTVIGKTDATLVIPARRVPEPLFLEMDMLGGSRCRTDTLTVDPGDVLQLDIWPDINSMPECRRRVSSLPA